MDNDLEGHDFITSRRQAHRVVGSIPDSICQAVVRVFLLVRPIPQAAVDLHFQPITNNPDIHVLGQET